MAASRHSSLDDDSDTDDVYFIVEQHGHNDILMPSLSDHISDRYVYIYISDTYVCIYISDTYVYIYI